jgi:hypothetical protein
MPWYHYVSFALAGLFLSNAVPHHVAGVMGRPFQSPFAKPPGEGFSSSTVNVLWGGFNLLVGYLLLFQVGAFDPRNVVHVAVVAVPAFALAVGASRGFGRYNGGNDPVTAEEAQRRLLRTKGP